MEQRFFWLVLFLLLAVVSLLTVPRRDFLRLIPFGLMAGLVLALALLLLAVPVLDLFEFKFLPPASFLGVPFFAALSWMPVTMLFVQRAPEMHDHQLLLFWTLAFASATTVFTSLANTAGFIQFINWDLMATLLTSFSVLGILGLFAVNYDISLAADE